MSNVCGVPTGPSTPGSPLATVKKLKANPLLCYCMHAGSAASPQQSSHVQQHNTKQSARGHTMALRGPADSEQQDSGWGAEATEIFTEACFVAFVLSDWRRRPLSPPPTNRPNSLDDVLLKKEERQGRTIKTFVSKMLLFGCGCAPCVHVGVQSGCVGAWSCRILIREDRESQIIHHLLWADNNTSGVSSRRPTVFVKHVRVTEQQRVRRTVD